MDWTKKVGRKHVGWKQVGRKLGARFYALEKLFMQKKIPFWKYLAPTNDQLPHVAPVQVATRLVQHGHADPPLQYTNNYVSVFMRFGEEKNRVNIFSKHFPEEDWQYTNRKFGKRFSLLFSSQNFIKTETLCFRGFLYTPLYKQLSKVNKSQC